MKSRGYHLHTVQEYGKIIESAGFVDVKATNMTPGFIDILKGNQSSRLSKCKNIVYFLLYENTIDFKTDLYFIYVHYKKI